MENFKIVSKTNKYKGLHHKRIDCMTEEEKNLMREYRREYMKKYRKLKKAQNLINQGNEMIKDMCT